MEHERDLLAISLNVLIHVRLHPFQNKLGIYIGGFISIFRFTCIYLVIKLMIHGIHDVDVLVEASGSLSSFMQGFTKYLIIYYYRENLQFLLSGLDKFWSRPTGTSENTTKNPYKNWMRAFIFYKCMILITFAFLVLASLLNNKLMITCYVPEVPYVYSVILFGEYIEYYFDAMYVIAFDLLFIGLCVITTKQFETLGAHLVSMKENINGELIEQHYRLCIEQHIFLLRYTKVMYEAYQKPLFIQYLMSGFSICIQLFKISESQNMMEAVTAVFYMVTITIQLALYCFPADALAEAASSFSLSMYETKWYNYPLRCQKYIPLVIQRSYQVPILTAGGLVSVDRETFTRVFKNGLSFYTVIKSLK